MGKAMKFINEAWVEVETTLDEKGKILIDGVVVDGFVSTYLPVKGHTAVLMTWEEMDENFGMYTPWNTWYGNATPEAAWRDALEWAQAEDIPAIKS